MPSGGARVCLTVCVCVCWVSYRTLRWGRYRNLLLYILLLMLFNVELRKRNIFREGRGERRKAGIWGGQVFGISGNPRVSPLNKTLSVSGLTCFVFFCWIAEVPSAWIDLNTKRCSITERQSSVYSPYTITNLEKS